MNKNWYVLLFVCQQDYTNTSRIAMITNGAWATKNPRIWSHIWTCSWISLEILHKDIDRDLYSLEWDDEDDESCSALQRTKGLEVQLTGIKPHYSPDDSSPCKRWRGLCRNTDITQKGAFTNYKLQRSTPSLWDIRGGRLQLWMLVSIFSLKSSKKNNHKNSPGILKSSVFIVCCLVSLGI